MGQRTRKKKTKPPFAKPSQNAFVSTTFDSRFGAILVLLVFPLCILWRYNNGSTTDFSGALSISTINTFPHDETSFTQGLTFHDGDILESTGWNGRSHIKRIDLKSGQVLQQQDLDEKYFGEGICVYKNKIIQLTYQAKLAFVYDIDSFELIDSFRYETDTGQGWGITNYKDQHLILSDGSNKLYFLDPVSYKQTKVLQVFDSNNRPMHRINELEMVGEQLWANIWFENFLVRINPLDGAYLGLVDFRSHFSADNKLDYLSPQYLNDVNAVFNGIALKSIDYANNELVIVVTGKMWKYLYEVTLKADES